jgi:hypothetical protein
VVAGYIRSVGKLSLRGVDLADGGFRGLKFCLSNTSFIVNLIVTLYADFFPRLDADKSILNLGNLVSGYTAEEIQVHRDSRQGSSDILLLVPDLSRCR